MTGNIPLSYKVRTGEKTEIEDAEDDVDGHPDSDFYKASARVFDKIYYEKDGVLPSSKFVDLIETFWGGFIVSIWRVICGK